MKAPKPFKIEWVQKLFRELSPDEKRTVRKALGYIPWHKHEGDVRDLWPKVQSGEVAAFTARNEAGKIVLVSFYTVRQLTPKIRDFLSIGTVALDEKAGDWTRYGMEIMETVAKSYGCQSLTMHTLRPGLARVLVDSHGWFASEIVLRKKLKQHGSKRK